METIGNDVIENCVSLEHNPIPIKFHKKRIKKIIINNFRAFQTEEIEFDKFNCIIGKNDSGKSTLFAALEWFFNANKVLSENDFAASGFDISKDKQDMYNDLTISVEVYFSGINIPNSSTEYNFIYAKDFLDEENCLCIRKYMKHPMSTILGNRMGYSIKSFPLIRNGETIFTERYKKSSEELEKIYSKYFLDDLPSKLYELEDAESDAEIVSEIEYLHIQKNNIKRQICDNLHNLFISSNEMPRWEDFHNEQSKPFYLDWFNSYQFQIYAANTPISNYLNGLLTPDNAQNVYISIEKAKTKTAGKLFKILQNNNVIENISFKTNESINLFTNNSVNFKILDLPIWIPLKNRGDGLQLMIKQAVIEMLAVEQLGSSNVVFAFEEPETHLHPDAQIKMYKIIKKLSENPKYQVFMTTHSPYIVKELAKDRINPIVIERDEKNNKSSKRDLKERVLPYVSMNEINYIAFDLASEEFHQELYGQIEIDWFGESNGSKIDQIIEKLRYYKCANSDKSFNELVKTLIDKYNNDNNSNIDLLTNEFFSPDKGKEPSRCLCHCVRNSIDHPCEGNNKWKEYGLIDLSINILLQIYSCFKDIKKTFLDRISDLTESELDGKFHEDYYVTDCGKGTGCMEWCPITGPVCHWSKYTSIYEIIEKRNSQTSIPYHVDFAARITVENGRLHVPEGLESRAYMLYDLNGRVLRRGQLHNNMVLPRESAILRVKDYGDVYLK